MARFYFHHFPRITYSRKRVTNLMLRFRIREIIEDRTAVYYTYQVKDGERPDVVAYKYYGDEKLDWLVMMINDVYDVHYDWPLSQENLFRYIKDKYGSIPDAKATVHHREWIITPFKKLSDGTIVHERTLTVDEETFDTLSPSERREVTAYDYEVSLNEDKASIKLLDERHVSSLVNEVEGSLDTD